MKGMLAFFKGYRRETVTAPVFKMLEALFDLFVPLVMADIVNNGIAEGNKEYILMRCGLLVALGVIGLACSISAQYFAAKASVGYCSALRRALFSHIQGLGFSELDTMGTSTLITRMTSDINQVQNGLNLFLRLFLRSPFIVFGSMIMAFTIDWRPALVFVIAIPVLSAVVFGIMLITMPKYRAVQSGLDEVTRAARENLSGVRVIRAFGREESEKNRFKKVNSFLTSLQLHVGKISAVMNPMTYVIINLAIIAVLYTGAVRVDAGGIQQGDVIALVNYMSQILIELVKLANLIIQVTKAAACAGRINDVLRTEPDMKFALKTAVWSSSEDDAVRFSNVFMKYKGASEDSIADISFSAKRGQTIGIIGGTGSGKTTLVSLIPRFYDASSGTVFVMGRAVEEYSRQELRGMVATVMQKAMLFKGTIRSNLLWGDKNADDAELWRALETAQAAEFVKARPKGLDEPVEQGGRNFSGGQKQRLTIARALVSKPDILILDDSASALDLATDAALRRAIGRLGGDMTVFIVSQRTSGIMHADNILVLEDGELAGWGTHEQLLTSCPVYKEIYSSQHGAGGETA